MGIRFVATAQDDTERFRMTSFASVILINMKARYSVTAVVTMRDRGGEQIWNTSHWMFTRSTPGQGERIQREKRSTRVDCSTLMGALRNVLTGRKDNRRWRGRRRGTGMGYWMRIR